MTTTRVSLSKVKAAMELLGIDPRKTIRVLIESGEITVTEFAETNPRTLDPESSPEDPFYKRAYRTIAVLAG